jgi:hypothetical protein
MSHSIVLIKTYGRLIHSYACDICYSNRVDLIPQDGILSLTLICNILDNTEPSLTSQLTYAHFRQRFDQAVSQFLLRIITPNFLSTVHSGPSERKWFHIPTTISLQRPGKFHMVKDVRCLDVVRRIIGYRNSGHHCRQQGLAACWVMRV